MKRDDEFYKALLARDYRFDGKFFVGVKTTGIYCRPICPAKPKRQNVEFFTDALSAEKAGYRPCLRCRPESAPQSPAWMGRSSVVQRALKLIAANALTELTEDDFADQLGVSARHLRRLFEIELGKTPKQISDNNRLNFARKLIAETALPVTEIAFTAGFASIRRFNDAFKERFHRPPSEIRKQKGASEVAPGIKLSLPYRPPLNWQSLLQFYKNHEMHGIESVTSLAYSRVFKIDDAVGAVTVSHDPMQSVLILQAALPDTRVLYKVCQNVRQMFDLDSDPLLITNIFSSCSTLSKIYDKYPGLRIPRGFDAFEIAICSILGQLVSVENANHLVKQLIECYGQKIKNPLTMQSGYLFPAKKLLAESTVTKVGTTHARKETIRAFSQAVLQEKISLSAAQDPASFKEKLRQIKGIGPWTAEYICLRALGDTDAFPETDLILKRALVENPAINIETLSPWRGYAAIYLWKEFAQELTKKKRRNREVL